MVALLVEEQQYVLVQAMGHQLLEEHPQKVDVDDLHEKVDSELLTNVLKEKQKRVLRTKIDITH